MYSLACQARTIKSQRLMVTKFMRNHLIVSLPKIQQSVFIFTNEGVQVPIHSVLADGLAKHAIAWTVHGYFIGRTPLGDTYIQSMEPLVYTPVKYDSVRYEVGNSIQACIERDCNPKHYISGAWIAVSEGRDVPEELAFKIFDELGIFKEKANWEEPDDNCNASSA